MSCVLAANVAANLRVVKAVTRPELTDSGTFGDDAHQAGAGDHTCRSTHVGKFGYPTQGEIHAEDIGATTATLALLETFIRRSWRRRELAGLKYLNVLNRHWNIQTSENWRAAVAGTLKPRYSGDPHAHLSFENGSVDSDLLLRFLRWVANGQRFPDEIPTPDLPTGDDDMTPLLVRKKDTAPVYLVVFDAAGKRTREWIRTGAAAKSWEAALGRKTVEVADVETFGPVVGAVPPS